MGPARRGSSGAANIRGQVASVERVPASLLPRRPFCSQKPCGYGELGDSDIIRDCPRPASRSWAYRRTRAGKTGIVRCFVAAFLSTDIVAGLENLPRPHLAGLRWTGAAQWHVTLRFLGQISPHEATEVVDAIRAGAAAAGPGLSALAEGGPTTRLLGPGLVIWPVAGLDRVAGLVRWATAGHGQPPDDRPFLGHVTLARAQRGTDLRPHADRLRLPLAARWPVSSVELVQSHLHPHGARYKTVARVPLS